MCKKSRRPGGTLSAVESGGRIKCQWQVKYTALTEEEKIEYKHLYEIWMTNKYEVDGEILYPKGARYPVTAADTPEGLPLDMKMYWDIT